MLGGILCGNVREIVCLVVEAVWLIRPVGFGVELRVFVFACDGECYLRVKEVALRAVMRVSKPVVLETFREIS